MIFRKNNCILQKFKIKNKKYFIDFIIYKIIELES